MTQIVGYVGTNYGFRLALREVRKQWMAGRDLTLAQVQRIYRKAKMLDLRRRCRRPTKPAA